MTPNVLYGIYYVCRLSMNIVRKPIVEEGVFSETELGIIGSCLFFVYAVGKLTNGFLADRSNVRRFMSTDLLCSALIHLLLGFTNSFYAFVLLWGLNGWFQSMGAASGVVSLSRWYNSKECGTYYGFWSASHNIGEAFTFMTIALIVGWMEVWNDWCRGDRLAWVPDDDYLYEGYSSKPGVLVGQRGTRSQW